MEFTFLLLTFLAGFALAWLFARTRAARTDEQLKTAAAENARLTAAHAALTTQLAERTTVAHDAVTALASHRAESDTRLAAAREQAEAQEQRTARYLADIEKMKASLQLEFQAAAAKLLEEKSAKFTDLNKNQVEALLHPLRQQLTDFRLRVDTVYKTESDDRAALKTQIEQLRLLNTRITDEAHNLTRALKGQSQARGAWGELVLERLLESSGLRAGEDYVTQSSLTNDDGRRLRPDIVLRLPDERHLVIDSKVSLVAYEQAVNATEDAARDIARRAHTTAVRRHVEELSAKRYEDAGNLVTPDYVLMFVPIEPAFSLALDHDPALYEWAFDRRVILVTAPTLLATLKTVASLWKQDRQTKNALEIARRGGLLHDKFVGLYTDLEIVGKHLAKTRESYDEVFTKLKTGRGNLLSQVDELKSLGAKASKSLPAPDVADT